MEESSSRGSKQGGCCSCHDSAEISGQPLPWCWPRFRHRRDSHREVTGSRVERRNRRAVSRTAGQGRGREQKQREGPLAGLLDQIMDRGGRHAQEAITNCAMTLAIAQQSIAASLVGSTDAWGHRKISYFRPKRKRVAHPHTCCGEGRLPHTLELPNFLGGLTSVTGILCQRARHWQVQLTGDKAPLLIHTLLASLSTAALAATIHSPKSAGGKGSPYKGLPSPPVGTPAAPLRPRRHVKIGQKKPKWVKDPPPSSLELAREIALMSVVNWSGFIRPVDKIWEVSSDFGPRWGRHHNGVDLAAPYGEPVLAADCGTITFAGWEPSGYGYLVEITHKDGWRTLYAHNSSIYTWEGQAVKQGDCIASVGATGRATGPHLHWEIRNRWGSPVDPAGYVEL